MAIFNTIYAICNNGYQNAQLINGVNNSMMQGFNAANVVALQNQNAISAQLAQCCCDNRAGQKDIQYQMATDTCAVQNTIQNTTRDVLDNQNANARAILDALTAQRIEAKDQRIAEQAAQIQSLQLAASQANQNAVLRAAMDANTAEILRKTGAECPMPAYVVQPPQPVTFPTNCCGQVNYAGGNCGGCGC